LVVWEGWGLGWGRRKSRRRVVENYLHVSPEEQEEAPYWAATVRWVGVLWKRCVKAKTTERTAEGEKKKKVDSGTFSPRDVGRKFSGSLSRGGEKRRRFPDID